MRIKKGICSMLFLVSSVSALQAQVININQTPVSGEITEHYEFNVLLSDTGQIGNSQIWDFSSSTFDPQNVRIRSFRDLTSSELSIHPNSNLVGENNLTPNEKLFFNVSSDSIVMIALNADTGEELIFSNPDVLFKYPAVYNSVYYDTSVFQFLSGGVPVQVQAIHDWSISAQGVLITPNNTFNNAFKVTRHSLSDYYVQGALIQQVNQIEVKWFIEGYNVPLAEVLFDDYTNTTVGFFLKDSPLSIESIENENTVIYPNPTSNNLYFPNDIEKYELYNLEGQLVLSGIDNSLSMLSLPEGCYFVRLFYNNKTIVEKVIKY